MRYDELENNSRLRQLVDITAQHGTTMRNSEHKNYARYKALCDATIAEQAIEGKYIYTKLNKMVDNLVADKVLADIDDFDWSTPEDNNEV